MEKKSENAHDFAYRRHLRRRAPGPSRLEILKASIKTVSKEYCEESSICGLKHLVDETTPAIERYVLIILRKNMFYEIGGLNTWIILLLVIKLLTYLELVQQALARRVCNYCCLIVDRLVTSFETPCYITKS